MKTLLLLFLLSGFISCFGQDSAVRRKPIPAKQLFRPSHIGFTVVPYLVQKTKISGQQGEYSAGSDMMTGIEGGAEYRFNLKTEYSVIAGIHGGISGRDYTLNISKNDFVLPLKYDIDISALQTRQYDFYVAAPIWFERRWRGKNNGHWNLTAGVNIRFYYGRLFEEDGAYGYYVNQQPLRVFDMKLKVGNDAWPWVNYNIGAGYSFPLRNQDFLRVNLLANLSGFEYARGGYTIDVTGKQLSTGNYSANMSYIGLSASYILTRAKRQMKKKAVQANKH